MKKAIIIGRGNIGQAIMKEAQNIGWRIEYIIEKDGVYHGNKKIDEVAHYSNYIAKTDIAFLAIPTIDGGKIAFDYIQSFIARRVPIVTCEKGALSNFYAELRPFLHIIGYSATVGGGTRMLNYMHERGVRNMSEVHAVLNGTLNFIFSEIESGKDPEQAGKEALSRGYAEPGSKNLLDSINRELQDVLLKSVILYNASGLFSETLRAHDISLQEITIHDFNKIIVSKNKRCVISITKHGDDERIGGFHYVLGDWNVYGGFTKTDSDWLPRGAGNALLVVEGESRYVLQGPGAGAKPTALSMIEDARILMR